MQVRLYYGKLSSPAYFPLVPLAYRPNTLYTPISRVGVVHKQSCAYAAGDGKLPLPERIVSGVKWPRPLRNTPRVLGKLRPK